MKKNGFTLAELLGVIVVIAIISGLAVISVSSILATGKKGVYKNYEETLEGATRNYFIDNINKIPSVGMSTKIYLDEILSENYLDNLDDPNGGDCNSEEYNSYVLVTRQADINNNYNLEYKVCLMCYDYDNNGFTYKSSDDC